MNKKKGLRLSVEQIDLRAILVHFVVFTTRKKIHCEVSFNLIFLISGALYEAFVRGFVSISFVCLVVTERGESCKTDANEAPLTRKTRVKLTIKDSIHKSTVFF